MAAVNARRTSLSLCLLTAACSHWPAPRHPRPALPLPADIARHYALPGPVHEELLVPLGVDDGLRIRRGALRAGDERAEFHYLVSAEPAAEPVPFVLCLPILAGGRDLMWFVALEFAHRGYAVAWPERVGSALTAEQDTNALEDLFRRTVIHNRMVLAWAKRQPEVDPERTACVGISMGGIVGGVLAALEPDLRGVALCLAGADLGGLLRVSAEPRARRWRAERRAAEGLSGHALADAVRRALRSDPARVAAYVPTDKVLLVGGWLDAVVPPRHQDLLWEALGRPERRMLPLGHYTAALGFWTIMGYLQEFLAARLGP